MIALLVALANADVPPPSGSTYISTVYRIENFAEHPQFTFYVGPMNDRRSNSDFREFRNGSVSFGRIDRGSKQIHSISTEKLNAIRETALSPVKSHLEREEKRLKQLDPNSTDPVVQKQIKRSKSHIRSIERQALGEEYHTEIEKNLIACSLKTSTQYVSSKGPGNWVNTLRIVKTSPAKCPLKLISKEFVPRVNPPVSKPTPVQKKPTSEKDTGRFLTSPDPPKTEEQPDFIENGEKVRSSEEPSGGCASRGGSFSWAMIWIALMSCLRRKHK